LFFRLAKSIQVCVAAGDDVVEGQTIAVVSAMKMEVEVKAPGRGKIKRIVTETGSKVIDGALMIEFE